MFTVIDITIEAEQVVPVRSPSYSFREDFREGFLNERLTRFKDRRSRAPGRKNYN